MTKNGSADAKMKRFSRSCLVHLSLSWSLKVRKHSWMIFFIQVGANKCIYHNTWGGRVQILKVRSCWKALCVCVRAALCEITVCCVCLLVLKQRGAPAGCRRRRDVLVWCVCTSCCVCDIRADEQVRRGEAAEWGLCSAQAAKTALSGGISSNCLAEGSNQDRIQARMRLLEMLWKWL